MSKALSLIQDVLEPKAEFTPIPFWFINDDLIPKKLKAQLEDFKEKGVDGVVVHPRIGIPKEIGYLSDKYFEIITFIVKTASDLDMQIILYDEGMYPSGAANGQVVAANPDFAAMALTLSDEPDGKIIHEFSDGKYLIEKKSGGTIRGIHFGEDDGEENAPLAADILNPEAVAKFISLTHDAHYHHLKEYFGTTIIAFFTDEPDPLGRNTQNMQDWTPGIEMEIVRAGGVLSELRALFEGKTNETTKIYKRVIRERFNEVYYKVLSDWCQQHGIALTGHPAASDDIDEEIYFQIPGQDMIFRMVSPEEGGIYNFNSVQGKCSADAARHLGRRRNANECFGVCVREDIPWYFTGEDMKWYIDWLAVRGVNLFIPHAFYYSIRGKRKDERPPDVGPNNIWWSHYKYFSDYMKRLSYLMTDAPNVTDIAILCESKNMPHAELIPFYENQIEFNYLPKSFVDRKQQDKVEIQGYTYTHLLDPDCSEFSQKIADYVKNGKRDFLTELPCPGLRVTHLQKNGIDMYFLFNEGKTAIDTDFSVSVSGELIFVDLWKAEFFKGKNQLKMKPFETLLIVVASETTDIPVKPEGLFLGDLSQNFQLITEDKINITKTYMATYQAETDLKNATFEIHGEEMAECFINGKFLDVSFASPHRFCTQSLIKKGCNEIKVIMTGNIANRHSDDEIPYGIE